MTKNDTNCPMTVAHAAPRTPKEKPKIMIGSRMIFVTAPDSCPIMVALVLPQPMTTFSMHIYPIVPREKIVTIRR